MVPGPVRYPESSIQLTNAALEGALGVNSLPDARGHQLAYLIVNDW